MSEICKICGGVLVLQIAVKVRSVHSAKLNRCTVCGLLGFDEVFWLDEAYRMPINPSDVGYVFRNVNSANILAELLFRNGMPVGYYLDYGSGYGMFVRLMRDRGYCFHGVDPYCESLFASLAVGSKERFGEYELVSAFEVFEHLADPVASVEEMLKYGKAVIFTTDLVPDPVPAIDDWDYYGLEHGQHVAFWTKRSLTSLAGHFGLEYLNLDWISTSWHLIAPKGHCLHTQIGRDNRIRRWSKKLGFVKEPERPQSLLMRDYKRVVEAETHRVGGGDLSHEHFHLDDCDPIIRPE